MTTTELRPPRARARTLIRRRSWSLRRATSLVERNVLILRHTRTPLLSSILEPTLYLLSIGVGVGVLVGKVAGVDVRYAAYVAPAILATTAMNAAFNQTTFAVFSRLKEDRTYDAIVPTPLSVTDIALGEVASAVILRRDLRDRLHRRDGGARSGRLTRAGVGDPELAPGRLRVRRRRPCGHHLSCGTGPTSS